MRVATCLVFATVLCSVVCASEEKPRKPKETPRSKRVPLRRGFPSNEEGRAGWKGFDSNLPARPQFDSFHGPDLVSIAHDAAIRAKSAEKNQHGAGTLAAFHATNNLAEKAAANAATAQAANAGKQALVSSLQKQLHDAYAQVETETVQLRHAENAAKAAQEVAHQASHQVISLRSALGAAHNSAARAQESASAAASEAASQSAMLEQAHERLSHVSQQLGIAQAHLMATQRAAKKAAQSAKSARAHANRHVTSGHGSRPEQEHKNWN